MLWWVLIVVALADLWSFDDVLRILLEFQLWLILPLCVMLWRSLVVILTRLILWYTSCSAGSCIAHDFYCSVEGCSGSWFLIQYIETVIICPGSSWPCNWPLGASWRGKIRKCFASKYGHWIPEKQREVCFSQMGGHCLPQHACCSSWFWYCSSGMIMPSF